MFTTLVLLSSFLSPIRFHLQPEPIDFLTNLQCRLSPGLLVVSVVLSVRPPASLRLTFCPSPFRLLLFLSSCFGEPSLEVSHVSELQSTLIYPLLHTDVFLRSPSNNTDFNEITTEINELRGNK